LKIDKKVCENCWQRKYIACCSSRKGFFVADMNCVLQKGEPPEDCPFLLEMAVNQKKLAENVISAKSS
jgi:hypothetical protein